MRTLLSVIGARPQFVKHASVQQLLQQSFDAKTLHTGQHYDYNMSALFFEELGIPQPDYTLQPATGKTQGAQTAQIITGIEEVCLQLKPEAMILYGDTNTTLAGALVAVKLGIPIFHIEAGIRSFNREMPEEINRIVADNFASLLFCPIPKAVQNLQAEGVTQGKLIMSGDVMLDTLLDSLAKVPERNIGSYYFTTIHRPYNTDDPARMQRILDTLNSLPHPVIFALHPRTAARLKAAGIHTDQHPHIQFIAPLGYLESIAYQRGATCIITDSGGVQKEAYMLRKKCITLRSETEWTETLEHGWNTLVFEDIESIAQHINEEPGVYIEAMFGDGKAAEKIVAEIKAFFEKKS